ncbi:hypothetical protein H257_06857 [Aphanomyces astaci]|uniref:Uncharacterized protein n=1 Tax=Aphanomyces astaci TaxID=112090 RepID=W4GL29_APHAT|nr:hypothetical protein H257_06857 [Aphanomyces astaci]ETV79598.1 hypothetical protein H257_06857 [Aphanomyces astaci]|eukprot:XP_009830534.1 hypothetical protein H257_06857 [Aphanomyces astaci]
MIEHYEASATTSPQLCRTIAIPSTTLESHPSIKQVTSDMHVVHLPQWNTYHLTTSLKLVVTGHVNRLCKMLQPMSLFLTMGSSHKLAWKANTHFTPKRVVTARPLAVVNGPVAARRFPMFNVVAVSALCTCTLGAQVSIPLPRPVLVC